MTDTQHNKNKMTNNKTTKQQHNKQVRTPHVQALFGEQQTTKHKQKNKNKTQHTDNK